MNDIVRRAITAFFFLIVMLSGLFNSQTSLILLMMVVNFLAIWEYQSLVDQYPYNKHKLPLEEKIILSLLSSIIYIVLTGTALSMIDWHHIAWILPIIFGLFVKELYAQAISPFVKLSLNLTGIIYITLPCALVNVIAYFDGHFEPTRILGIMLLVWSNDTAAYLSGRAFGRHKLFERISPKKTWEGTIGGGLFTLFVGWLLSILFPVFSLTTWLGIAALAVLCGTWGDLIESLLKRSLGVKDSGSLLPGHGGVLDRFDALLFVLPFVFAFLYLWGV